MSISRKVRALEGDTSELGRRHRLSRTQFNLLDKSLPNARPDLLESIRSGALPAAKVALLTSADLASAERLEELEKAKQAALAQTVKSREDMTGVVRLGRDGFEKVEDAREKEMVLLARQEEAARAEAERRREAKQEEVVPEVAVATEKREIPMPRSESLDEVPNFAITSAWTGPNEGEAMQFSLEDQTALDLSDLIEVEPEVEPVVLEEPEPEPEVRAPALHAKPVVWSGQVSSPLSDTEIALQPIREGRPTIARRCSPDCIPTSRRLFGPVAPLHHRDHWTCAHAELAQVPIGEPAQSGQGPGRCGVLSIRGGSRGVEYHGGLSDRERVSAE